MLGEQKFRDRVCRRLRDAGGLAINDIPYFDRARAGGGRNPVAFGFVALVMTCLVIASCSRFSRRRDAKVIFVPALPGGVCAMMWSQSAWKIGVASLR